jgi:hypothetical protein
MVRIIAVLTLMLGLAACTDPTKDLARPVDALGDFTLGHSIVVAPNLQKLLVSRDATEDEWIRTLDQSIEKRFRRYDGGKFYHFGISVEAYSLPPPVVPGKSALALRLTVWDDAAKAKMNEETHLVHVIQVFESRLALTREQQMTRLADQAALQIEQWLREQMEAEGWFATARSAPAKVSAEEAAAATAATPEVMPDAMQGAMPAGPASDAAPATQVFEPAADPTVAPAVVATQ